MKQSIYSVALLGMSEKGLSTFVYFVRKQASKYLKLDIAKNADVFIVDFDTKEGVEQWHTYCVASGKPAILLASTNPNKSNIIWVKKPVASNELLVAIPQLIDLFISPQSQQTNVVSVDKPAVVRELDISQQGTRQGAGYQRAFSDDYSPNLTLSKDEIAEICGVNEDVDFASNDFEKQAVFTDEKTILHFVKQAVELAFAKKAVVYLEGLPFELAVLGDSDKVFVDLKNRHLRHLCAMVLPKAPTFRVEQIPQSKYKEVFAVAEKTLPTVEQVVWQIALWTSRGRLIKPLSTKTILHLTHWPNFTKLVITPYALQIAALLVRNDMTVEDLVKTLQIPQRYIFTLATAAYAIDLVQQRDSRGQTAKLAWGSSKPSFFNTILRSLRFA